LALRWPSKAGEQAAVNANLPARLCAGSTSATAVAAVVTGALYAQREGESQLGHNVLCWKPSDAKSIDLNGDLALEFTPFALSRPRKHRLSYFKFIGHFTSHSVTYALN
jgi:hypothetical protein